MGSDAERCEWPRPAPTVAQSTTPRRAPEAELGRVTALSDSIFAVAMTLLVLELHVPDLPAQHTQAELAASLDALWPQYVTCVVSFLVVGEFWLAHRQTLGAMRRVDQRFLALNLLFLLSITVVPFQTAILGRYWNEQVAVQVYAAFFSLTASLDGALWGYATYRRRLVDETVTASLIAHRTVTVLLVAGIFVASIGIAAWSPTVAELSWVLIWVVIVVQHIRTPS
jgi:uncharacterized membrane protein